MSWSDAVPKLCLLLGQYAPYLPVILENNFTDRSLGFETVVDIALAIYPALLFRKLNMRIVVKVGLIILFSMGIL